MGISGLLPLLKMASENCHVRKLSGCTVAIDGYSWLHKGCFGCAEKLAKGEPTEAYVNYCMKYIQVLLDNKVKPILVLDGRNLPSKAHTEKKRSESRDENRKLARKYLQEGNRGEAWKCFTKCVDITPEMARNFIKKLRSMNIDYVVAPYEADAQMAYMAKTGIADVIITEDSDLILFGCPKIFFKMKITGDGVLFDQSKLPQCMGVPVEQFDLAQFRRMCILSGCDYLASLPGIGLGKAKKVAYASKHADIRQMLLTMPSVLENTPVDVTEEYIAGFIQAENTFLYQLVFDTVTRTVLPLNPYPDDIEQNSMTYAGKYENADLALGMALGNVDIHTLKTVDNFEPMHSNYPATSIWSAARMIVTSEAPMIGLGISTPISRGSASIKKKHPKAITNEHIVDSVPDDKELINMYSRDSNEEDLSSHVEYETSSEFVNKNGSPSAAKRRRIVGTKTEESHAQNSPSRNTRSTRSNLPFFKSPENPRVHVKSKYFRTGSNITAKFAASLKAKDDKSDSSQEVKQEEDNATLNCLVVSRYNDISASSQSSTSSQASSAYSGSNGNIEDQDDHVDEESELQTNSSEMGSSTSSAAIITLDDAEGKAYGFMGLSSVTEPRTPTTSSITTRPSYTTSPYFEDAAKSTSAQTRSTRRPGLSRVAVDRKVDSKQRSVKDMFAKQMGKG